MNKLFRIAVVAACLLAVLAMNGSHWFALQSYAWVRMTIEFSKADGLGAALEKTFSGRHPCKLCVKVQQGWNEDQRQEKKQPLVKTDNLPEVLWEWRNFSLPPVPVLAADFGVFASGFYYDLTNSPPVPPPRA